MPKENNTTVLYISNCLNAFISEKKIDEKWMKISELEWEYGILSNREKF